MKRVDKIRNSTRFYNGPIVRLGAVGGDRFMEAETCVCNELAKIGAFCSK